MQANLALVDLIKAVAERKQATVGQVALAWLLAQKPCHRPDPRDQAHRAPDENLGSADLQLTAEDLAELDTASASVQVQGAADQGALVVSRLGPRPIAWRHGQQPVGARLPGSWVRGRGSSGAGWTSHPPVSAPGSWRG